MKDYFDQKINDLFSKTLQWRQHLHQYPELSFKEYETTKYIIKQLEPLSNIEIIPLEKTGVLAILNGKHPGKTIGLRADIDALAIQENNELAFKSQHDQAMHACGHDAHTAMLLSAAYILNDLVDKIHGRVIFIFQHAEETSPGGAIDIVKSGLLDEVDHFFGQHVMPIYPTGSIAMKKGIMFASGDGFDIMIQGKGGHAASPHLSVDPLMIAVEIIQAFQTIVSRKTLPLHNPIISTTTINTNNPSNVIPDTINFKGNVRNFDENIRIQSETWIKQIATGIAQVHGGQAIVNYKRGYAALVNDEACFEISREAALSFLEPKQVIILDDPQLASEDFSAYTTIAPSNYVIIGSGGYDLTNQTNLHSPDFILDEKAMYYGVMMHLQTINHLLIK